MSYLALLAAGALEVEGGGDLNDAVAHFNDALSQKSVPEQLVGRSTGYFFRGVAYYYLGKHANAVEDSLMSVNRVSRFRIRRRRFDMPASV
jgi:hypothetical protein